MLVGLLCTLAAAAPPSDVLRGRGVAVGLDGGRLGRHYASGLKVDVPLVGRHFGLRARGTFAYTDHPETSGFSPTNGGGLELWWRSPVLADVLRLYGGGGPQVAIDHTHELAIGGGGHFGAEALVLRQLSLTVEAGRHWGRGALDATRGASLVGGVSLYLGNHRADRDRPLD